jgi:hypothetical protein
MKFQPIALPSFPLKAKQEKRIKHFNELLVELEEKVLPSELEKLVQEELELIPSKESRRKFLLQLHKSQRRILYQLEKQMKLVLKRYYMQYYMILGMVILGAPIGSIFIGLFDNGAAFMGAGFGIGLALGIAFGTQKDQTAASEGRQLNWESPGY